MSDVIYAVVLDERTGTETAYLTDYEELNRICFPPDVISVFVMDFILHGKTYNEKKSTLREKAVMLSNNRAGGLGMNQEIAIANWFRDNGKRYGLLREFETECIC